jgi:hypothetical protein
VGDKAEVVYVLGNLIHGNVGVKEGEFDNAGVDVFVRDNNFTSGNGKPGNVKIEKMTGGIAVVDNIVGNIQVFENLVPSPSLDVGGNEVAGDLQVSRNRGTGNKVVTANTVGGNLQCFDNDPPFSTEVPDSDIPLNTVAGNAEGQCAQP